jgi:type I restriction enzyme R subunit
MVVSLDKFTAVKMYDKVQRLWKEQIKELRGQIKSSENEHEKKRFQKQLEYMRWRSL